MNFITPGTGAQHREALFPGLCSSLAFGFSTWQKVKKDAAYPRGSVQDLSLPYIFPLFHAYYVSKNKVQEVTYEQSLYGSRIPDR